MSTTVPDIIGPYEVIRPVAQGGMAEVFEVRDPGSGERLALKLLVEMKSNIKRFNREFEALTRLNHPGIVRVFRYGYHGRNPWITMELLEGTPLQSRVKSFGPPGTPRRTSEVIRIGYAIASALQYMHDRGLVHRDLKSANVQVLPDGRIKVIDFGTAHLADPLERITADGDFIGTFSYAAPEQLLGSKVDHRADLYSLGVLLYRLTTGRRPFKASDPRKVARMHLEKAPRPPIDFVPDIPRELNDLILWALEKKRADRPQQAYEIASALEAIAQQSLSLAGHGIAVHDERSVGRDTEHRRVWSQLREDDHPDGLLVVGGDEGERSSFVRQLARDAAKRGWRCVIARSSTPPQVSVAASLRAIADGDDDPAHRELLDLLVDIERVPRDLRIELLYEAERLAISRLRAIETPVMLVLEDVPRFDAESFAPVASLVRRARRAKANLVVVGTAQRVHEAGIQALRQCVSELSLVELEPLDVWDTALAVGGLLHRRPPPPEAARRIHALTGGRPTYVERVVRELVEEGDLVVSNDDPNRLEWEEVGHHADSREDLVQDELLGRLHALPLAARRLLEVLGELDGRGTRARIAKGLGWKPEELDILIDELRELDVLRSRGDELIVIDPLMMKAVDRATTDARRSLVQVRLAPEVQDDPPSPVKVRILLGVGRTDAALEACIPCVQELLEAGRAGEALELADDMERFASHPGLPRGLRARFQLVRAASLQRARPMDPEIPRVLRAAESIVDDAEGRAQVKLGHAELQQAIGHAANYRKQLTEAWEAVGDDSRSPVAVEVALRLGEDHRLSAQLVRAGQWFEKALSRAMKLGSRNLRDRARLALADLMLAKGTSKDAARAFESISESEDVDEVLRWIALAGWAECMRRDGKFSLALGKLEETLVETRKGPSSLAHTKVLITLARIEHDLFRLGRADEFIDELVAAQPQGERLDLRLEATTMQGRIQLASGQLGRAILLLREVIERADPAGMVVISERARASLALALWMQSEHTEAATLFRQAYKSLEGTGHLDAFSDVVVARSLAVAGGEDPARTFAPVSELLDRSGFRVLYLEYLLAEYRHRRANKADHLAEQSLREAQAVLGRLASSQSRIEQAAMRVHPWTKEIKRAIS